MRATHRPDIESFCVFDRARNLDFNGTFIRRPDGNVLIDPVRPTEHDLQHMAELGGVAHVLVTNSDHTTAADSRGRTRWRHG